jgi:hypothetical protein
MRIPRPSRTVFLAVVAAAAMVFGIASPAGAFIPDDVRYEQVIGSYQPISGDFNGDGLGDIIWYAPGPASDWLWLGHEAGWEQRTNRPLTITGTYRPIVGDFTGDGIDDILFHRPGPGGSDYLWASRGDGRFASVIVPNENQGTPIVGRFNGDERDDIFWYRPGPGFDSIWVATDDEGFLQTPMPVLGTYTPAVGDFDGNGFDDILWGDEASAVDPLWYSTGTAGPDCGGCFTRTSVSFPGRGSAPVAGNFNGDDYTDVFWYGAGGGADGLWLGNGEGFDPEPYSVIGTYRPIVREALSQDEIVWYAENGIETMWHYVDGRFLSEEFPQMPAGLLPIVGVHRGPFQDEDVFFHGPGPRVDAQTYVSDEPGRRSRR